ncbi:autotransporter outer membrane beta-barrel domain-containing protein [Rahnella woolbedingensis]|uniref:Autotransporter outer membrane beta-barrel domain-containing protein n=1 Tax=Rahnella woolbedingensis TaxID=1510574 RepID=A0A419NAL7_9GAMM|nr:autotransporter outer membrane beta-barrel domain-containing protein [Rahnella woolbedingensis]
MARRLLLSKVSIAIYVVISSPSALLFPLSAHAVILQAFNPEDNDQLNGDLIVSGGSVIDLTGNQQFRTGTEGSVNTTLGALQGLGRIVNDHGVIGASRLDIGPANFGVTIPDPTTGGNTTFQVYNPASLIALIPIDASTTVPDVINVIDDQYINTRIADVSTGGTLNVNIGQANAAASGTNNAWTMAAKQSTLFNVDGTGGTNTTLNWNSNNRITFIGTAADPTVPRQLSVQNLITFNGAFTVQTLDNAVTNFNVTDAAGLKNYNDWLITQLKSGNLDKSTYLTNFNKAFTRSTNTIDYLISADDPNDDVAQAIGNRIVINASGANAKVNIAAGKTLEVIGANGGAIRGTNNAEITVNGKVSSSGSTGSEGSALYLDDSTGTNNGVINGGFINRIDGTGVGSTGFGSNGVQVQNGSTFDNNGIVNFATTGGTTSAINLGINSSASNSGNINVGINGSSATGSTTGVMVGDATASFINNTNANIYIGRGPQNTLNDNTADTAVNQSGLTAGVQVSAGGSAINNGNIVIGSRVQNAAGMYASGGTGTTLLNNGTIDINGKATTVPRENIGMSVMNTTGDIDNAGIINVNGVNGTGVKVVATNGNTSSASSTGTINVAGGADPASGTRNFGIWVEGQGTGVATATVDGPINLSGNGAIGVHARGNATVDVSPDAIPMFSQGSNQIAFFAFGPNAKINTVGNNSFNVTTSGSTLFRLEQGADFDGTDLSLTASGANSVGVMGTGTGGTTVVTKNATLEVSGNGATGLIVEGGATGSIDADTTINLSGVNAVGAIADGQKHTLAGTNSGSPVQSTALVSAASLMSAQNGLTGFIARNRASLTNTGDINFTGAGATGILVQSGATGSNTGNIAINDGGAGMVVNSGTSGLNTTASTSGTIDVNGGSIAIRTRGVSASGAKAIATLSNGSLINLNGVGAIGADALNGGTVNIASSATPTFSNTDQIAYRAVGAGSVINSATTVLDVDTERSTLYRIADGAALTLGNGSSLTASGANSMALVSAGTNAQINTAGSKLFASGSGAKAVTVEGGAMGNLDSTTAITLSGTGSIGGVADGQKHESDGSIVTAPDASTTLTSAASLLANASGAIGYMATNLGNVINNGVVTMSGADSTGMLAQLGSRAVNNNQITLTGAGSTGAQVVSGSTFTNNGAIQVVQGTGIDASGSGTSVARAGNITVSDGVAGIRISDGTNLILNGDDNNITSGGTAHGVLLDIGASGLAMNNTTLNITGSGNGIENRAETGNVTLQNATINVANGSGVRTATAFDPASTLRANVSGNGTAFNFTQANLATTAGPLTLGDGYVFNVTGAGGTGINANTTGDVVTSATVNITNAAGGSALIAGNAGNVLNTGVLTSASLTAPVVDLSNGTTARFENRGTVTPSSASAVAVSGSAGNDDVLLTSGNVLGDISTGAGDDTVTWNGGTLDGSLSLGAGNTNRAYINNVDLSTTRHITSGIGTDNEVSFSKIVARGGTFDADDLSRGVNLGNGWNVINFTDGTQWELTGDLQLAHSNVNIDNTSTLFAGNGVDPVISGGELNSAIVTNAGLIDLTNGSGSPGNSLTINGDLVSDGGTVNMITDLNEGGVRSNQFTDTLKITGNASSGTTILDVTPAAASTGVLTDLNHSSSMQAYEGISLVQVAGNSSVKSFALKGGYLAAGPWRYDLYSFAPGNSDANQRTVAGGITNTFWDYRIGNAYVCEGDACNKAVPPVAVTPANPGTPEAPSTPVDTSTQPLTNPPDDGCVVNGVDNCAPGRRAVTPQVPAYISAPVALAYYNASVIDDLHKRLGELRHEQSLTDGTGGEMFLRYIGSNMTYKSNVGFKQFGYDFDMDYNAMQIGGNVLRLDGDKDSLRGGLAYTRGNSRMRPKAADGYSSTTFDSNSIALYLTWQRQNGFYMDGVLSFDNHHGETDISRQNNVGSPKAKSWSASLESGYPYQFDNGMKLEPQAQLMYTRINMDNFTDKDSTTVDYQDYSQTIGRVGLRADRTWLDDTGRQYTPYVRANYYRGWGGEAKTTIGAENTQISQNFTSGKFGQMGELGGGGTVTFKNDLSLYAEVDYRKEINSNGAKGWGYTGGVRWTF